MEGSPKDRFSQEGKNDREIWMRFEQGWPKTILDWGHSSEDKGARGVSPHEAALRKAHQRSRSLQAHRPGLVPAHSPLPSRMSTRSRSLPPFFPPSHRDHLFRPRLSYRRPSEDPFALVEDYRLSRRYRRGEFHIRVTVSLWPMIRPLFQLSRLSHKNSGIRSPGARAGTKTICLSAPLCYHGQ